MSDLGLTKDNYSCIIMQDVYERLDEDIVRRYRSKIELRKELGQSSEEDLHDLCNFLRAEATTLELSSGLSQSSKKMYHVEKIEEPKEKLDPADPKTEAGKPKEVPKEKKTQVYFGM